MRSVSCAFYREVSPFFWAKGPNRFAKASALGTKWSLDAFFDEAGSNGWPCFKYIRQYLESEETVYLGPAELREYRCSLFNMLRHAGADIRTLQLASHWPLGDSSAPINGLDPETAETIARTMPNVGCVLFEGKLSPNTLRELAPLKKLKSVHMLWGLDDTDRIISGQLDAVLPSLEKLTVVVNNKTSFRNLGNRWAQLAPNLQSLVLWVEDPKSSRPRFDVGGLVTFLMELPGKQPRLHQISVLGPYAHYHRIAGALNDAFLSTHLASRGVSVTYQTVWHPAQTTTWSLKRREDNTMAVATQVNDIASLRTLTHRTNYLEHELHQVSS